MAEDALHDRIEKYLNGELSASETKRFESELAKDSALSEQVELQRLGLIGIQRLAAADLRQKFDRWDEDLDVPLPPPPKRNNRVWVWTTAILLLLLMAGSLWHFLQPAKTRDSENREIVYRDSIIAATRLEFQQLQDSFSFLMSLPRDSFLVLEVKRLKEDLAQKDKALRDLESRRRAGKPQIAMQFAAPSNTATRGGNEATDPVLAAEKKAFDAKNFQESIRLLKGIAAKDPRQAEVKQRLPYSLFYAGNYEAAIPAFLDLLEADQFEEMNVQWHLLLCYVAIGEPSGTRYLLNTILKNPKHKYNQKAAELKKALNIQ